MPLSAVTDQLVSSPTLTGSAASRADSVRSRVWASPWAAVFGSAALAVGSVAALVIHDPHRPGSWGYCPFHTLTGWYCPGCGSLRAVHDLAVGRFSEAVGHNLLVVPALIWLGWWWIAKVADASGRSLAGPPTSARFCKALLVVLAAFVVLRNLPGSPLAP